MKKIYLLLLLVCSLLSIDSKAQVITSEADPSYIMLGYNEPIGQIYQYDGIGGVDYDATVGCAVKITAEMLKEYVGATIKALNIGWSNPETPGKCVFFVKKSINGEDIASSEHTLYFGWNEVSLDTEYVIPEQTEDLYIGFFTVLPANTICLPTFYPKGVEGSCMLWREGDEDSDHNRVWTDMCTEYGSLAIQAKVEDPSDKFYDMLEVTGTNYYTMQVLNEKSRFDFSVKNKGMNEIYSVLAHFEKDGNVYDEEVYIPAPLYPGCTAQLRSNMKALGSGKTNFSVTALDGSENKIKEKRELDIMTMPRSVANNYKRTPLIEFFASESINIIPKYYNEFFKPGFEGYEDKMILVEHHVGDGLTIGNDESLGLMLDIVDNDSSLITVPVMMLDRTNYVDMPVKFNYTPMFSILFPDFARPMYDFAINRPTFANVNIDTKVDETTKKGTITVSGDIAEGILPEGEHLYITTYLIKKKEYSNSQLFLSQEEMNKYSDSETNMYIHHNILAQRLTPMIGEELDVKEGKYNRSFDFELEKNDDISNFTAVAFLTRGAKNKDRFNRYVINAERKELSSTNHINDVNIESDVEVKVINGKVVVSGNYEDFYIYDTVGNITTNLVNGFYIVKVKTMKGTEIFKIFINR